MWTITHKELFGKILEPERSIQPPSDMKAHTEVEGFRAFLEIGILPLLTKVLKRVELRVLELQRKKQRKKKMRRRKDKTEKKIVVSGHYCEMKTIVLSMKLFS